MKSQILQENDITAPLFLSFYASKQKIFQNEYVRSVSGYEYKFPKNNQICKYKFSEMRLSQEEFYILTNFFHSVSMNMTNFKFKDFDDYSAQNQILLFDESNNKAQITKTYKYTDNNNITIEYQKRISKPFFNSVRIKANEVNLDSNLYEICYKTGTINFLNEINNTLELIIDFKFYVNARFNVDHIDYTQEDNGSFFIKNLEIIEVDND